MSKKKNNQFLSDLIGIDIDDEAPAIPDGYDNIGPGADDFIGKDEEDTVFDYDKSLNDDIFEDAALPTEEEEEVRESGITFRVDEIVKSDNEEKKEKVKELEEELYMNETTAISKYRNALAQEELLNYEISIPYERIINHVINKLHVDVKIDTISLVQFNEKYLNGAMTPEVQSSILKAYYPAALNGATVNNLLYAIVPTALVDNGETKVGTLQWTQPVQNIKSYTNRYPEVFGNKIFTPAFKFTDTVTGDSFYYAYLSTLHVILDYLDLDQAFLERNRLRISIVDEVLSSVGRQNELIYAIKFTKIR